MQPGILNFLSLKLYDFLIFLLSINSFNRFFQCFDTILICNDYY